MHIVLVGDSILDNKSYVDPGDSVQELLQKEIPECRVTLLAVDGSLTSDIHEQIKIFPKDASHVFVSCGGNDAIDNVDVLAKKAETVEEALVLLTEVREVFRDKYVSAIEAVRKKNSNLAAFTLYNKVPDLNEPSRTALALFNEVMLEELSSTKTPIVDLRVMFNEERDYSPVSPIEPSVYGGRKIVSSIRQLTSAGFNGGIHV